MTKPALLIAQVVEPIIALNRLGFFGNKRSLKYNSKTKEALILVKEQGLFKRTGGKRV